MTDTKTQTTKPETREEYSRRLWRLSGIFKPSTLLLKLLEKAKKNAKN